MKKLMALILALICVLGFVIFRVSKNEKAKNCIEVQAMGADYRANAKQSNAYRVLWNSLEWEDNADYRGYDYIFIDRSIDSQGTIYYYYDSFEGIFYDITNNKHANLPKEIKDEMINSLKDLTFVRGTGCVID